MFCGRAVHALYLGAAGRLILDLPPGCFPGGLLFKVTGRVLLGREDYFLTVDSKSEERFFCHVVSPLSRNWLSLGAMDVRYSSVCNPIRGNWIGGKASIDAMRVDPGLIVKSKFPASRKSERMPLVEFCIRVIPVAFSGLGNSKGFTQSMRILPIRRSPFGNLVSPPATNSANSGCFSFHGGSSGETDWTPLP